MDREYQSRLVEIIEYWKILEFIDQENIKLQSDSSKQLLNKLRSKEITQLDRLPSKKLEVFHYFQELDDLADIIGITGKLRTAAPDEIFSDDMKLMGALRVNDRLKKDNDELGLYPTVGGELYFVIGAVERNDVVRFLRENFYDAANLPELPELSYQKEETVSWFTFKATAQGDYREDTLKLSPLLWAIICWKARGINNNGVFSLDFEDYYKAQARLVGIIQNVNTVKGSCKVNDFLPLLYKTVYDEYIKGVFPDFGRELYHAGFFEYNRYTDEKSMKKDKFPEDYTRMNMSFYKDDLNDFEFMINSGKIADNTPYGRALCDFVQSGYFKLNGMSNVKRVSVSAKETAENSFEFFRSALDITRAPLGKWPARFKPSLMQQAAINLAIDESGQPIFSVNGPPGTGKTTLLKEILAEYLVRRACVLAEVNNPDDAFKKCSFKFGPLKKTGNSYLETAPNFFAFNNDKINDFGILVASCNNAAVENITIDLPKLDDVLSSLKTSDDYDAEINAGLKEISELFDPGSPKNITENGGDILFTSLSDDLLNKPGNEENASSGTRTWGLISAPLGRKDNIKAYCRLVLKPFLKSYGSPGKRAEHLKKYSEARARFIAQLELVQKMRAELAEVCKDCTSVYAEYNLPEKYTRGADKMDVIDKRFITDYLSKDEEASTKAQLSNPWATDRFNREREKLFYYACKLHKEFAASSDAVRQNIENILVYWGESDGNSKFIYPREKSDVFPVLLQSLFLITPVLSTTFASVGRLLKDIKMPGTLGLLIVDESGQAEPHTAIGSLMRCRKAIIVGDPKQVEPVVTAEGDMFKQLMTSPVLDAYKEKTVSVQSFADFINPYGTTLGGEWVGCPLVVHRRCADPMYSISNELSYENTMKNSDREPKEGGFILPRSCWIDVKGSCVDNNNRFVEAQGRIVVKLLKKAFERGGIPKLYIISPFKTVSGGIEKMLKTEEVKNQFAEHADNFKKWLGDKNIGTVHTFQGKGTDEVIFLLGCDKNSAGAVNWVNKNIVNVAATRAKQRFYIIGDREVWTSNASLKIAEEKIRNVISPEELAALLCDAEKPQTVSKENRLAAKSISTISSPETPLNAYTTPTNDEIMLPLNCPKCGKPLRFKFGKNGWFVSCSDFPSCKTIIPLTCPKCGERASILKNGTTNKLFLKCFSCKSTDNFKSAEHLRELLGL